MKRAILSRIGGRIIEGVSSKFFVKISFWTEQAIEGKSAVRLCEPTKNNAMEWRKDHKS